MTKPMVFNYMEYERLKEENKKLKEDIANLQIRCRIVEAERHEWIPVSKMMPKKNEQVLVTGIEAINGIVAYAVKEFDVDTWRPVSAPSVTWIAWMPLPEPYKGGEEE